MTRKTREELNALSKEVFGTSSRWQKIVSNGVSEPFQKDREVMVPQGGRIVKKTFTDNKSVLRRYSVAEVTELMNKILEDRKKITVALANADSKGATVIDVGAPLEKGMTVEGDGVPEGATIK
jgi:hypothetical protein